MIKSGLQYVQFGTIMFVVFAFFCLTAGCGGRKNTVPTIEEVAVETPEEVVSDTVEVMDGPVVYYERTHCFGTCPVFRFSASQDGACEYEGINFVDRIGKHQGTIDPQKVKAIETLATSMNYFSLDSIYDDEFLMDLPAVITIIRGKTVINRFRGPKLNDLYASLDSLIEEVEWELVRDR